MAVAALLNAAALYLLAEGQTNFRFVILGDRTGEAQSGVFEQCLRESAALDPAFLVTAGDAIEGGDDERADGEWNGVRTSTDRLLGNLPIFFIPGNHDVWSERSERAFEQHAGHPVHYSFDFGQAHFTILDNSRTEQLSSGELAYLEKDLGEHSAQPLKFVFSHRPSWVLQALLGDRKSKFQVLAEKYHVQYFISGHIHQILYFGIDGVHYLCMPSAGGHLRGNKQYINGWFFGYTEVAVHGHEATLEIHELMPPFGKGRTSVPADWGAAGLRSVNPAPISEDK